MPQTNNRLTDRPAARCAGVTACRRSAIRLRFLAAGALLLATLMLPACHPSQPQAPVTHSLMATPMRTQDWTTPYADGGRVFVTPHYYLFVGSRRAELAGTLPGFMEGAYANYTSLTGLQPRNNLQPMRLYMMADRHQWVNVTRSLVKEQLELYLRIEAGGYCYQGTCVFWDIGGLSSFQVASHEGLHQFLYYRLVDRVPMWLEEGLGTAAEGFQLYNDRVAFSPAYNTGRVGSLQAAIVGQRLIPLQRLLTMHAGDAVRQNQPGRAVEYYAQLWSLIMYIRSQPQWREGMERILSDAALGRLGNGLGKDPHEWTRLRQMGGLYNAAIGELTFRRYITQDTAAFEKGLRAYQYKLAGLK